MATVVRLKSGGKTLRIFGGPKYRIESEKHYQIMDSMTLDDLDKSEVDWAMDYICKVLDDSAFNLGLEIVPRPEGPDASGEVTK